MSKRLLSARRTVPASPNLHGLCAHMHACTHACTNAPHLRTGVHACTLLASTRAEMTGRKRMLPCRSWRGAPRTILCCWESPVWARSVPEEQFELYTRLEGCPAPEDDAQSALRVGAVWHGGGSKMRAALLVRSCTSPPVLRAQQCLLV